MRRPFRTSARALAAVAFALVAGLPVAAHAAGEPGPVARAYLDLRAAAGKAAKPESLPPHLSARYQRVVGRVPAGERDEWFQRFKRFPPTPVTIQAQAFAGDRGALGAVARPWMSFVKVWLDNKQNGDREPYGRRFVQLPFFTDNLLRAQLAIPPFMLTAL